jgi:hypothetical protein
VSRTAGYASRNHLAPLSATNTLEAVFADPGRFDITRSPNPHVGFGAAGAFLPRRAPACSTYRVNRPVLASGIQQHDAAPIQETPGRLATNPVTNCNRYSTVCITGAPRGALGTVSRSQGRERHGGSGGTVSRGGGLSSVAVAGHGGCRLRVRPRQRVSAPAPGLVASRRTKVAASGGGPSSGGWRHPGAWRRPRAKASRPPAGAGQSPGWWPRVLAALSRAR